MGAMAQKERVRNQPYADLKWLHLGFHVGIHSQDLLLTHTGVMTNGETWFAEIPSYSPGFSVGVIGDMYMNPYFNYVSRLLSISEIRNLSFGNRLRERNSSRTFVPVI